MRLTGYNANPKRPCFDALYQAMCYLWHHPHVPLMYSHSTTAQSDLHVKNGSAEFVPPPPGKLSSSPSTPSSPTNTLFETDDSYQDGDLGRDLIDCRSVSSTVLLKNGTAHNWSCHKQTMTADCTNGSELRALHSGVRQIIVSCRFLASGGFPVGPPTRAFEDNSATISQILKDCLTPQVKHLDLKVTWLHQQKLIGIFHPFTCPTRHQLADFNSKPTGGESRQQGFLYIVGARFNPPSGSKHYTLLGLGDYNIGIHHGSFHKL